MLINICDNYHPLYRLQEYFLDKDIKLLAGEHAGSIYSMTTALAIF